MGKNILMNEESYITLVKTLMEEINQNNNIIELISNYSGNVGFINSLKKSISSGKTLSSSQIRTAKSILGIQDDSIDPTLTELENYEGCHTGISKIKEKYLLTKKIPASDYSLLSSFFKEENKFKKDPNSMYQYLGSQTYLNMVKGSKRMLFDVVFRNLLGTYKIDSPSDSWYKKNIEDLKFIKEVFGKQSNREIFFRDEKFGMSLSKKIDSLIQRCENREYIGILEVEDDDFQKEKWSILNKIDTNYTNWKEMLEERRKNKPYSLIRGTEQQIICDYFKQRKLTSVSSEKMKNLLGVDLPNIETISLAEYDLLEIFTDSTLAKLKTLQSRIGRTTELGNNAENDFKTLLSFRDITLLRDFSEPGNLVDTNLGIDMVIEFKNVKYAVQVKASKSGAEKYPFITKLGINYLVVFPQGKNNFGYFSNTNPKDSKNFDKDFLSHKYEF